MKVILVGLAQSIGGWLATAALLAWLLHAGGGAPLTSVIGVALLMGAFIWVAIGLFIAAIGRLRERAAILRGDAGRAPIDGKRAVLVGRTRAVGATLSAPLDGSPCVMYSYEVIYDAGSGRRRSVGAIARGVGLASCRIVTASGEHKLLAVPKIEGLAPRNGSADQLARFKDHMRRTTFVKADAAAEELLRQWADDDGVYRSDVALDALERSDDRFWSFRQQHVPAGEAVCVFGVYSREKGGIVPASATPVRVEVGHAREIAERLGRQATRWSIIGLALLAVPVIIALANRQPGPGPTAWACGQAGCTQVCNVLQCVTADAPGSPGSPT